MSSDQESPDESPTMCLEKDSAEGSAAFERRRSPPSIHKHQDDDDFLQLSAQLSACLKGKLAEENFMVHSEGSSYRTPQELPRHLWQQDALASACSIISCRYPTPCRRHPILNPQTCLPWRP